MAPAQSRMAGFFATLSGEYLPIPQEQGRPRFFYRRAHWVRNPNHPATAAGGVGPLPMPPDVMQTMPPAAAAVPPVRPADAATQTNLFGNQTAEEKYELLLRFQAASDDFYQQKREQMFAQLTPGMSVHCPIDVDEETDTEDIAVHGIARKLEF